MRNLRGNRTRHWPNESRSARENINSLSWYYVKLTWWLAYRGMRYIYIYIFVLVVHFFFIEEIYVHASLLATRAVTARYATLNTDDITLRNSSIMFNLSPTIRCTMTTGQLYIRLVEETVRRASYFRVVNCRWDWNYCGAMIISVLLGGLGGYQGILVNPR